MAASKSPAAPSGQPGAAARPGRRRLERLSRAVGLVGGLALFCAMLIIVASVIGGTIKRPILGDTELVEVLIAMTVFSFLPHCQLHGGNVIVDFFARPLPQAVRDWLDAGMNAAFAGVAAFMTWRLATGGISAYARDQRGMFLQLPEWPVYAVGFAACLLWIAVILYTALEAGLRARGRLAPLDSQLDDPL